MKEKQSRPINLDLQTMRFPITAIASILHRVTGVIMFIAIGLLLAMLSRSLSSPVGFIDVLNVIDSFLMSFILWGILTALAYHFVAGIRHLLMDRGYFEALESGSMSAKICFGITLALSIFAGVFVW